MQEIKEHIYSLEKKYGRNVEARRAFNSALRGGGFLSDFKDLIQAKFNSHLSTLKSKYKDGSEGDIVNGKGKKTTSEFISRPSHGFWLEYTEIKEYDGEWKNGKYHGKGKETIISVVKHYDDVFRDSYTIYDGEWEEGKKNGKGIFINGSDILNGKINSKYDGEWKDDKEHGKGIFNMSTGDVYDGEWKEGKRHGRGRYTFNKGHETYNHKFVDGDVYDGEWKEGKMHGCGTIISKNGRKQTFMWEENYTTDKPCNE